MLSLLSPVEYHLLNLLVATDNWFTSMKLALKLLELGIYLFGTCKVNKMGIPKDKVFTRTGANVKRRGECQCSKTTVKVSGQDHSMYFVSWMDNKPVHFLSTIPTRASVVSRAIKEGNTYKGHNLIGIPTLAQTYNGTMGGTDRFDQQMSYYESTIRTKRWQPRIFTHFTSAAAVNAHILYRSSNNLQRGDKGYSLLSFIDMLIDDLAEARRAEKKGESAASRYVGLHCPVKKADIVCSDGTRVEGRQRCKVCSARVNTYCEQCDVALCFGDYEYPDDSCFKQFHTCCKK